MAQLPIGLSVILVLMAVWLLIRLIWLLLAGPSLAPQSWESDQGISVRQTPWNDGFTESVRWTLFDSSNDRQAEAINRLPVEQGNFSLVGVVLVAQGEASDDDKTFALIQGAQRDDVMYRVGDRLPDGREIERIERTSVVLLGPLGRSVLMLQDRELKGQSAQSAEGAVRSGTTNQREPLPRGIGVASLGGLVPASGLGSQGEMSGNVMVMPVTGGGYRLRPGAGARWFGAVGLQVNDVLVAINGQAAETALQSGGSIDQWVGRVLQGERVALTVERNGQMLTVEPSLAQLQKAMEATVR